MAPGRRCADTLRVTMWVIHTHAATGCRPSTDARHTQGSHPQFLLLGTSIRRRHFDLQQMGDYNLVALALILTILAFFRERTLKGISPYGSTSCFVQILPQRRRRGMALRVHD